MIISGRDNLTKNIRCEDIYETLIEELGSMASKEAKQKDSNQIVDVPQKNPFEEHSSSQDSIDTFVPIGSLTVHLKEKARVVFEDMAANTLNRFTTTLIQIKNRSFGKLTKFNTNTEEFFKFLRTYFENMKLGVSPMESFIQILERENNRSVVEPFAIKYFKVIFYLQKPINPSFYEVSMIYNLLKVYFKDDPYIRMVVDVILREFILTLTRRYVSNISTGLTNAQINEFSGIIESTINAFNGTVIELDTEASEICKIIYVMLCFYLSSDVSEFYKIFGMKELFYCAVRSVYQGHEFSKKLECLISSKLRWRLKMDDEEYTCDKVYQTLFKYEYRKLIGKIKYREKLLSMHFAGPNENYSHSSSSEENQRYLVTKIIQTTLKSNKAESKPAFSPLSRRIGESLKNKESLDSKRKLRFE